MNADHGPSFLAAWNEMPKGKQSCDAGELRTRMIPSQPCDGARRATLLFDMNEVLMAAKLKQPDGSKLRLRDPILRPGLDRLKELKASVFQTQSEPMNLQAMHCGASLQICI